MRKPVVFLVEDNVSRAEQIRASLPDSVHCVWARTPGMAIGILKRDHFSGILLDYSFREVPSEGRRLNGADIAEVIAETQNRSCEILVHSNSPSGAEHISTILRPAGFHVEQRAWNKGEAEHFRVWAEDLLSPDDL